jgi:hypothetical protein
MQTLSLSIKERVALIRMLKKVAGPQPWDDLKKVFKIIERIDFSEEEKGMSNEELDALPEVSYEFSTEQMTFINSTFEKNKNSFDLSYGVGIISLADKLGYGDVLKK